MSTLELELEDDLIALLRQSNQPVEHAVRELIVLELYRRGTISSGKAAALLHLPRIDFIQHASRLGIPYLELDEDEWRTERTRSQSL